MGGQVGSVLAVVAVVVALAGAVVAVVRLRARRGIATAMQRATYDVLHTAGAGRRAAARRADPGVRGQGGPAPAHAGRRGRA